MTSAPPPQLELYARVRSACEHELFLAYGTLPGAVGEDGSSGDADVECAFVSARRDPAAAARDLQQLAFALIDAGFAVRATRAWLQVTDPGIADVQVTVFHLYLDGAGVLRFPHGVAGTGDAIGWAGTREITVGGVAVLVPADAEVFLDHVCGPARQAPEPDVRRAPERHGQARDALLPADAVEEVYWADFYARTVRTSGSAFCRLVGARPDLPATVVDIGCGDGRDSYAFAGAGRTKVTGLDRSHVGVRQAVRRAEQLGLGDRLSFTACDVGDAPRLRAALDAARAGDTPMLFYLRFFLHAIPEDVQQTLMGVIGRCARPGDQLAAEFRTEHDATSAKVHGAHYRRFQNGPAFGVALRDVHGFTLLLEQEGIGLSPYQGEDPHLYRVIARRG